MGTGDLVLMGPPGSGKGTQARFLADTVGWVHLATGDLFREHLRKATALGKLAGSYMEKGEYVPDDVTVPVVRERVAEIPLTERIVFDGFPRTVVQAEALDRLLADHRRRVSRALLLDVPREQLVDRLSRRLTCSQCQTVYSTERPPRVTSTCDRCGGPVRQTARADDSPDVVRKRLEVYDEQTRPVIAYYERAGVLRRVDGLGSVEDIRRRVQGTLA